MKLYRNYNGGHILSNVNPNGQPGTVFLGEVVKATSYDGQQAKVFNASPHAPQYLQPTPNELRYFVE